MSEFLICVICVGVGIIAGLVGGWYWLVKRGHAV